MSKKKGIITAIAMMMLILVVLALIFFMNYGDKWLAEKEKSVSTVQPVGKVIEEDGKVHGANLSAFLNDESFFDQEPAQTEEIKQAPKLSLLTSSVEKDLRIRVMDEEGQIVKGHNFKIIMNDEDTYIDSDLDGMVTIENLNPGTYQVRLEEVEGYEVPKDPIEAKVKAVISYTVIDDISYLLHTEDELPDLVIEDSKATENEDIESDDTECTSLMNPLDFADAVQMGIDVSKWNKEIDWQAVKNSGVEFAIIRVAFRGATSGWIVEDPYYKQNLREAKAAGIKVGIYFFTQAINTVEAVEEASMTISLLQNEKLDYPIYIDIEGMGGTGRADLLDQEMRTAIADAFCQTIKNAGYEAGIYSCRNWYEHHIDVAKLSDYHIWLAEYRESPLYEGPYEMWQYTSKGTVDGISGWVDLDMSYQE